MRSGDVRSARMRSACTQSISLSPGTVSSTNGNEKSIYVPIASHTSLRAIISRHDVTIKSQKDSVQRFMEPHEELTH